MLPRRITAVASNIIKTQLVPAILIAYAQSSLHKPAVAFTTSPIHINKIKTVPILERDHGD